MFNEITGFEWDESKRRRNVEKHGIDFARARSAFLDAKCIILRAKAVLSESREIAIGQVDGRIIAVVFTRRTTVIRIISARAARRTERKQYE